MALDTMYAGESNKIKVLVIDDSRVVRVAATRMFDEDFDVVLGVDGADGLAILERDPDIDVVFTDLAMPEMDGFELLEAVRSHTDENLRELPIIVATGAGNPESAKQKAFSLGATDFVTKPFNGTDIKARARSYAKLHEQNRSLKQNATIDNLTGLLNGRGLKMQLEKEISFAARHESNLTLISLEVDNYKDLFVRIGREGTEKVVKRVAKVLEDAFRKEDSISRVGIARYIVSMPMSYAESAVDMANRICHTIESLKAKLDGKRIKITVSTGVSSVLVDDIDAGTLIGMANEALQRASEVGASQIYQLSLEDYRKQLDDEAKKSLSIDHLLDQIEAGNQLAIAPQVDNAIERLGPFFKLLSDQQVAKILTARQKLGGNIVDFNSGKSFSK
ncbi:GGDEF domain-containing response regulator [Agarilytica rhodophyticola]|uniref:GGDEF domain-containing response regulator n=1 Tax=Agarilytica rhodophyticola TaxID=1737490 RepID=UPI000B349ECF|nr:diguanylate cyclase [Agarilytica rhodophyticola]